MKKILRSAPRFVSLSLSISLLACAAAAQKPSIPDITLNAPPAPRRPPSLLERGAAALELPLSPWGPYAQAHYGPCFLADGARRTLFTFPIVVGQRRKETVLQKVALANGKARTRMERAALERRLMGLAPMQAWNDDRPAAGDSGGAWNRYARLAEADGSGLLWSYTAAFKPAALTEAVMNAPDAGGKIAPPAAWGAGEAAVSYFPANVTPGGDGLLIRVALTNRGATPQTYFVDVSGGRDANSPPSVPNDYAVERDAETGGMMIHSRPDAVTFALASNATAYPQRSYRVSGAYFSPEGAVSSGGGAGGVPPYGLLPDAEETRPETTHQTEDKKAGGKESNKGPDRAKIGGVWGLLRVDEIAVAPGETVTITLCVGLGKNNAEAADAAQSLLGLCDDALPDGQRRKGDGLATRAAAAHRAARFRSGDAAIDRLMAQSLANTPERDLRRVGVASRRDTPDTPAGTYQTVNGGWTALGWVGYRQDWSAAQLNACYLTNGSLDAPLNPQAAPPVNLFALWELYQKTHDHAMLARFYPFAKRRYREFLTAGRVDLALPLFAWPRPASRTGGLTLAAMPLYGPQAPPAAPPPRAYAPDYSAYVIRAAKILRLMAYETSQPAADLLQYGQDITAATAAMNDTLWDAKRDTYAAKSTDGTPRTEKDDAQTELMPLIAGGGAVPPPRRAVLINRMTDPSAFWSGAGIRSLSQSAAEYHSALIDGGAVGFGQNWLLWKALLDAGEAATAQKLADNLLHAYAAQSAFYDCPEALDGDAGTGLGVPDFTGDSCALIPLYQAYHTPGTVASGWDLDIRSQHYDRAGDAMSVSWRVLNTEHAVPLLCVMGRPNATYHLSGSLSGAAVSNANGLLTLTAPKDATTQSLEITPQ